MSRKIDLTGQRFGRLVVLYETEQYISSSGVYYIQWLCRCDCGNQVKVLSANLRYGRTRSCGCLHSENQSKIVRKYNTYSLTGEYGIGFDINNRQFYFDLEDYDKIKDYCWHIDKFGYVKTNKYDYTTKKSTIIQMHRLLLDCPDKKCVDHINHNTSDNRKCNLRIVSSQQNAMNNKLRINNVSGVTGISFNKNRNKWKADITVNYKNISLGNYSNFNEAVRVRKIAEEKYFGEYSYDNSMKANNETE